MIRNYLLGHLDADPEVVERIDEQMLGDHEFSENVDVIEDEILEEYLEGTLSSADRQAVERHFLRPPERQRKLQNARLLSRHFATAKRDSKSQKHELGTRWFPQFSSIYPSLPHFRMYAEIAAAVLLIVSTVYLVQLRRELQTEVREGRQKLPQEHEHSAALNQQLKASHELAQPATVLLTLLQPGLRRGDARLPELKTGAGTKNIHVEIALPSVAPGAYKVQLERAGKTVWSQDGIQALTAPGGAILMFDAPAQVLTQGECRFVVRQRSGLEISYWFLVLEQ
jgi:hypothetical protein